MASLKHEIAQERPFSSPEEEALLNLMRTADCLQRAFQRVSREWGVTTTQYNVLRILRGSHPQGLTCSAIGDRMITAEPDITRLLGAAQGSQTGAPAARPPRPARRVDADLRCRAGSTAPDGSHHPADAKNLLGHLTGTRAGGTDPPARTRAQTMRGRSESQSSCRRHCGDLGQSPAIKPAQLRRRQVELRMIKTSRKATIIRSE